MSQEDGQFPDAPIDPALQRRMQDGYRALRERHAADLRAEFAQYEAADPSLTEDASSDSNGSGLG